MSWSFTNLNYGWKIAIGITLSAVSIYVANNIRERINQADEIELDLAVAERCFALQYGTNSLGQPLYYIDPPQYVRSWYSNNYETQVVAGVTSVVAVVYTNIYTNAVGCRTDRAKAVARDATIKALVPYYCDTNTVYDGTTNIVMLTVTGLWASLGIGDHTNQFTSVPEWVGTNGVTNAATYGELPWRIYKEDLEERYKVLNALKMTKNTLIKTNVISKLGLGTNYTTVVAAFNASGWDDTYGYSADAFVDFAPPSFWGMERTRVKYYIPNTLSTSILINSVIGMAKVGTEVLSSPPRYFWAGGAPGSSGTYINVFSLNNPSFPYTSVYWGNDDSSIPDPGLGTESVWTYSWSLTDENYFINWQFQFCTNKYW